MSARARVTNNSVASLDEQTEILGDVLSRAESESISKLSEKERKKILKKKKEQELAKLMEKAKSSSASAAALSQAGKPSTPVTTSAAASASVSVPTTMASGLPAGARPQDEVGDSDLEETSFNGGLTWAQMQAAQARAQAQAQAQAQAFQMAGFGNFVPNFSFGLGAPPQWGYEWSQMNDRAMGLHSLSDCDSESEVIVVQPIDESLHDIPKVNASGNLADFFKEQLVQVKESDKVAPRLDDELAVVVNKILSEAIYPTDMDKLSKAYPRIENVEFMKVPKLDSEIYDAIDQKVRNFDQSLQNIQKAIMSAVSAIAPTLRLVYNRQETDQELNGVGRQLGESIKLLGYATNNLSTKRRELIKPSLDPKYAKTMSKVQDSSPDWLFGGDLVTTTRKCEVSQKIGEKVLKRKAEASQGKPNPSKKFRGRKAIPSQTTVPKPRKPTGISKETEQCQMSGEVSQRTEQDTFQGGQIQNNIAAWKNITKDPWVLDVVEGLKIPFVQVPNQTKEPYPYKLSQIECEAASLEIQKLIDLNVLELTEDTLDQVISNIFLRDKKDGSYRMILDLTWLNKLVDYEHFKMHGLHTAVDMIRHECWMGSVDLRHAYYSVSMDDRFRKYLRFRWNGLLYQYKAMPNGLACAPRYFTKILNPIFAHLRQQGHEVFQYLDDSFVVADSKQKCHDSLLALCTTLSDLGFVVHNDKSVLEPTKQLIFLGFQVDSQEMTVELTQDKERKFTRAATDVLEKSQCSIREVAGLVGLMISYLPAFHYAGAHVKNLEKDKIEALKSSKGDFNATMVISQNGKSDIFWWLENIENSGRSIDFTHPDFTIFTDASEEGWGASLHDQHIGGRWDYQELQLHINVLELRAIYYALRSFCKDKHMHIKIMTDNTTALAYVKHMGGVRSIECNEQSQLIWNWIEEHESWLTIAHIPGVKNVTADYKSRHFSDNVEWSLADKHFQKICNIFGQPDIDLFASRLNKKVQNYVSFQPDPFASMIDAFTISWKDYFFYAFPPFSCIPKVLKKVIKENAVGILVVPWWPTQPWWARLMNLHLRHITFRPKKNNLIPIGKPNNVDFLNSCPLGAFLFTENSY